MTSDSILEMGNLLMVQERERFLSRLLWKAGFRALDDLRAFEAGCSTGYNLRQLVQWGAHPRNVAGMDLDQVAVQYCHEHSPEIRVHHGSAEAIPEPAEHFDLSLAFTLFSSIPDEDVSHGIARELFRITRPGGLILVYDMRRDNPRNPDVHSIHSDDIRRWFPKCPLQTRSMTVAPPIARPVARYLPSLYEPLAEIPWLRTHAMYILRRPALPPTFVVDEAP